MVRLSLMWIKRACLSLKRYRSIFLSVLLFIYASHTLQVDAYAKSLRIVSLAPSVTEILFALKAGDMVVGDTLFSNYPEEAKKLPKVGSYAHPSLEKIVSLHPDYVIGMVEGPPKDVAVKLREMGIKTLFFRARNISDIVHMIERIAEVVHKNPDPLVSRIKALYSHTPPPRAKAVFLVSLKPVMAATNRTFINSIMACAGLENPVKSRSMEFVVLNREFLLQNQPDYLIVSMGVKGAKKMAENLIKSLHLHSRLLMVNPDIYNRPSYRVVQACLDLRSRIH